MRNHKSKKIMQEWEDRLSDHGYRVTSPRRVILDILAESCRPLTPLEVYDRAREKSPKIGLVTIYRTIEKMEELHLIDRVHDHSQCQTVFRATHGHQHLLICSDCGLSAYFDGLEMEDQFEGIGQSYGFQVTGHWLQLNGVCPDCQKQSRNA